MKKSELKLLNEEVKRLQKLAGILTETYDNSWKNLEVILMDYYGEHYHEEDYEVSMDDLIEYNISIGDEDDDSKIFDPHVFDSFLIDNIGNEIEVDNFSIIPLIKNNKIFIKFKQPEDLIDYSSNKKITGGKDLILNIIEDTTLSTEYSLQIDKNIIFTKLQGKDNLHLQIYPSSKGFKYLDNVENILKKYNINYETKPIHGMGDEPTFLSFNLKDNPNVKINNPDSSKIKNNYTSVYNIKGVTDKLKVDYLDKGTYKKVYLYIKPYILDQGQAKLEDELLISVATRYAKLIEDLLEKRNISYTKQYGPVFSNFFIEKKNLNISKLDSSDEILKDTGYKRFPSVWDK
jgi:hypothetical protein